MTGDPNREQQLPASPRRIIRQVLRDIAILATFTILPVGVPVGYLIRARFGTQLDAWFPPIALGLCAFLVLLWAAFVTISVGLLHAEAALHAPANAAAAHSRRSESVPVPPTEGMPPPTMPQIQALLRRARAGNVTLADTEDYADYMAAIGYIVGLLPGHRWEGDAIPPTTTLHALVPEPES